MRESAAGSEVAEVVTRQTTAGLAGIPQMIGIAVDMERALDDQMEDLLHRMPGYVPYSEDVADMCNPTPAMGTYDQQFY